MVEIESLSIGGTYWQYARPYFPSVLLSEPGTGVTEVERVGSPKTDVSESLSSVHASGIFHARGFSPPTNNWW